MYVKYTYITIGNVFQILLHYSFIITLFCELEILFVSYRWINRHSPRLSQIQCLRQDWSPDFIPWSPFPFLFCSTLLGTESYKSLESNRLTQKSLILWASVVQSQGEVSFIILGFPCGSAGRVHLHCGRPGFGPWVWEDPLEEGKAPHSSVLAWRIPWTIESMGSQRVRQDWATFILSCPVKRPVVAGRVNLCWFFPLPRLPAAWPQTWVLSGETPFSTG